MEAIIVQRKTMYMDGGSNAQKQVVSRLHPDDHVERYAAASQVPVRCQGVVGAAPGKGAGRRAQLWLAFPGGGQGAGQAVQHRYGQTVGDWTRRNMRTRGAIRGDEGKTEEIKPANACGDIGVRKTGSRCNRGVRTRDARRGAGRQRTANDREI